MAHKKYFVDLDFGRGEVGRSNLTKTYMYNAGSAPSVIKNSIRFIGKAQTNSSGVATFYLTDNGQANGDSLFTSIYSIAVVAENNTAVLGEIPITSIKSLTNNKTLTINVLNGSAILLGGQSLKFAGSQIVVNVVVEGI